MKGLMDVSEELKSKLYDLERWEGMTQDTTQSLELRLQRIEEMAEQTANQLTVIHRSSHELIMYRKQSKNEL